MWRMALIALAVVFAIMCISQNMHSVHLNFPFTGGIEIRMVFLIFLWFAAGYGAAHLVKLIRTFRNREEP